MSTSQPCVRTWCHALVTLTVPGVTFRNVTIICTVTSANTTPSAPQCEALMHVHVRSIDHSSINAIVEAVEIIEQVCIIVCPRCKDMGLRMFLLLYARSIIPCLICLHVAPCFYAFWHFHP